MSAAPRPILISGAGWGAGASCAEQLAAAGDRLFLIERDANRCEAVSERTGGFPIIGDVTDYAVVERAVNAATLTGGGLSAFIHAIPLTDGVSLDATRGPELGAAFATHVAAILTLGSAALRTMQLAETGLLLRIEWLPAEIPSSLHVLRAAQHAAWTELAKAAAEFGVRVETLTVPHDDDPDEIATRVTDLIRAAFATAQQGDSAR